MYSEDQSEGVGRSMLNSAESQENILNEEDFIETYDEDGNPLKLQVIRYFYYNGEEYVVLGDAQQAIELEEADDGEELEAYIMKVEIETDDENEEIEVFSPIEDDELLEKLISVATTRITE